MDSWTFQVSCGIWNATRLHFSGMQPELIALAAAAAYSEQFHSVECPSVERDPSGRAIDVDVRNDRVAVSIGPYTHVT
jgi:hypothetical protein